MERKAGYAVGAAVVAAAVVGSAGVGIAAGRDGDDRPLTGSTLERATVAALEATGGGTVTESEMGDDGAAYEVEVRLEDGTQVEVRLDEDFTVTGRQGDDEDGSGDDEDGPVDD